MDNIPKEYWEMYFEAVIAPYIKKHGKRLFPEIEENLCLKHYNSLHKSNFQENDLKLNSPACWVCKQINDRP